MKMCEQVNIKVKWSSHSNMYNTKVKTNEINS